MLVHIDLNQLVMNLIILVHGKKSDQPAMVLLRVVVSSSCVKNGQ